MDKKRRRGIVALFLALTIVNYLRIGGHETVRPVLFLSIMGIGILSGILVADLAHFFRSRKEDKDRLV